jgi:hypothetical protein
LFLKNKPTYASPDLLLLKNQSKRAKRNYSVEFVDISIVSLWMYYTPFLEFLELKVTGRKSWEKGLQVPPTTPQFMG